ncbi:hypothetical protein JHK85_036334 [Glycine max]|nr:hypothetical protein JHK85_036334 [Glycine max]
MRSYQKEQWSMRYAKGIPLALKVLGSFLCSRSENEWHGALNIGTRSLLDKALISITSDGDHVDMHDLIQQMGREVVRQESIENPGQRSRLWNPEEVYDVLTNNRGNGAVEGICLDMTQITYMNLSSNAFRKMSNLRLLAFKSYQDFEIINSVYLPKGLECLHKSLRYFEWDGYPLESLPSTFCSEKLVEFSMPYSNVKKLWHGVQPLMSLSSNTWPQSLRELFLEDSGLNEVPPSILHIRNVKAFSFPRLEFITVGECKMLQHISALPPFIQSFDVWNCHSLQTVLSKFND